MKQRVIALDGNDGSGKTSIGKLLADALGRLAIRYGVPIIDTAATTPAELNEQWPS